MAHALLQEEQTFGLDRVGRYALHALPIFPSFQRAARGLEDARRPGDGMRVRVDKARHHHLPGGANFQRPAGLGQRFDAPARPHFTDHAVRNQDRSIGDDAELTQGRAAPGRRISAQRQQLTGAPN